jgi:tetratricopeptide (TPR) repeat protein
VTEAVPRSVLNSTLLILVVVAGHAALASVLSLFPSVYEFLAIPTAVAIGAFLFKLLPEAISAWAKASASSLLSSSVTTAIVAPVLFVELFLGAATANVQISWKGPKELQLSIAGRKRTLEGINDPTAKSDSWCAHIIHLAFLPIPIRVQSHVQTIRPFPFSSNQVSVPEYLAESNDQTELVELAFDRVFLQISQRIFHDRAQQKFIALRQQIGPASAKRLQDISELLEETYLSTRDGSEEPANLLLAYKTTYPGDPWIPALEASVALSERRYADATQILSDAIRLQKKLAEPTPTSASLSAMYAVSSTRLARELQANPSTRADAVRHLLDARQVLKDRLDTQSGVNTTDTLAALRWHIGLVDFYMRSDQEAMDELARVTPINAEPLLSARAKNAIGYIMLLNGRLDDADQLFDESSSLAPELPNPRINRGYVLLIRGKYQEAEIRLRTLLSGPDQISADRDRALARLALALSLDAQKKTSAATTEYESVLRGLRGLGLVEGEDKLRPALIRLKLAKEVYLENRDYYALEMWGAVLLGNSCRLISSNSRAPDTAPVAEIKAEINQNASWVFQVAAPRAELLQYDKGILSTILPRIEEPCPYQRSVVKATLARSVENKGKSRS